MNKLFSFPFAVAAAAAFLLVGGGCASNSSTASSAPAPAPRRQMVTGSLVPQNSGEGPNTRSASQADFGHAMQRAGFQ